MAIRMPRIAMTIISSIRVKPCWSFFMVYPLEVCELHVPLRPASPVPRVAVQRCTCEGSYARRVPMRPLEMGRSQSVEVVTERHRTTERCDVLRQLSTEVDAVRQCGRALYSIPS